MIKNLNKLAKKIISDNQYMTIGTSNKNGEPWVSPVVYAQDSEYNLYFISLPDSKHSQNIAANLNVSVAIFDSHQNFGEGVGLQIEGSIKIVPKIKVAKAISIYLKRKWPYSNNILKSYLAGFQKVLKNKTYRAYVFIPKKVWMNDPNSNVDKRVEVKLKED